MPIAWNTNYLTAFKATLIQKNINTSINYHIQIQFICMFAMSLGSHFKMLKTQPKSNKKIEMALGHL